MRRVGRILALTLVLLALAQPAAAAVNPHRNRVVFSRSGDLWTCNYDGSGAKRITSGPEYDSQPRWSANHATVFFIRSNEVVVTESNQSRVCTVSAAGGAVRYLPQIDSADPDEHLRWISSIAPSPDGKNLYIADVRHMWSEHYEDWIVPRVVRLSLSDMSTSTVLQPARQLESENSVQWLDVTSDNRHLVFLLRHAEQAFVRHDLLTGRTTTPRITVSTWLSLRAAPYGRAVYSLTTPSYAGRSRDIIGTMAYTATGMRTLRAAYTSDARGVPMIGGYSPNRALIAYSMYSYLSGASNLYTLNPATGASRLIARGASGADW